MSWDALGLAAKTKCKTPTAKLVLLMLANYSDEDYASYPSMATLADLCSCDERTIKRALRSLENDGLIRTEPRYGKDGKQTSNRYVIQRRGDIFAGDGVTNVTPDTIRDIQLPNAQGGDRFVRYDPISRKNIYPVAFEEWWNAYPRNDGSKKKAFEIWARAVDRDIDERDLFLKTCRFAQTEHGKDKRYTPYATTWLNQRRWETVEAAQAITTNRNTLAG